MHNVEYCPWCGKPTSEKTKIVKVVETYSHLPHEWSAWTDKGEELHIKHRWGFIIVFSMETRNVIYDTTTVKGNSNYIFNYNDLKRWTSRVFDWPEKCEEGE